MARPRPAGVNWDTPFTAGWGQPFTRRDDDSDTSSYIEISDDESMPSAKRPCRRTSPTEVGDDSIRGPVSGGSAHSQQDTVAAERAPATDVLNGPDTVARPATPSHCVVVKYIRPEQRASGFCICGGPEQGDMIGCDGPCDGWFHFDCVGLSMEEVERILKYVCPQCTELGGGKIIWKGQARKVESIASNSVDTLASSAPLPYRPALQQNDDDSTAMEADAQQNDEDSAVMDVDMQHEEEEDEVRVRRELNDSLYARFAALRGDEPVPTAAQSDDSFNEDSMPQTQSTDMGGAGPFTCTRIHPKTGQICNASLRDVGHLNRHNDSVHDNPKKKSTRNGTSSRIPETDADLKETFAYKLVNERMKSCLFSKN